MAPNNDISLEQLQTDVHEALKSWHREGGSSPLTYLYLYQQTRRRQRTTAQQTTNALLIEALDAMAVEYEPEASLLRSRFLDNELVHQVANELNVADSTVYRLQKEAIEQLATILYDREMQIRTEYRSRLEKRLEVPTYTQLVGVQEHLHELAELVSSPEPPWLLSLEGMGGIGKTSLADALARQMIGQGSLYDLGWVTARQQALNPGGSISPIQTPALTAEALIEALAVQLLGELFKPGTASLDEVRVALEGRLKEQPHLIVIDNLETVVDLESLLPTVRKLINPTKILLTTRDSLYTEPDIYHFAVPELGEDDARQLIRQEARLRNLSQMANASDDELQPILDAVGGNPLALRLVVGQTHIHALPTVLGDLSEARGEKIESLYTYLYRRAWDNLDESTRHVLLAMPLVTDAGGTLDYLADVSQMDPGNLSNALDRLVTLNLIDSRGGLYERRYTIHNLTRTFLHEQVVKWGQMS